MSMTISGTNGLTFNDASTQTSGKQACKAWAQFTTSGGVATVTGSFNISSVTRSATGTYSTAFTSAMANANYAVSGGSASGSGGSYGLVFAPFANNTTSLVSPTTSGFSFVTTYNPGNAAGFQDSFMASFAVFSA